jgi:hypothetical protein
MRFFATRGDLIPIIVEVERGTRFRYVQYGVYENRVFPEFRSGLDIPDLGQANNDSAVAYHKYLVIPLEAEVAVREMDRRVGGIGYFIDQLENPISVVFAPGGLFGNAVLLCGGIDTVSQGNEAQSMKRKFEYRMKKNFSKRGAYYVGSEAEQLRQQGFRLAGAVQSPRNLDLS